MRAVCSVIKQKRYDYDSVVLICPLFPAKPIVVKDIVDIIDLDIIAKFKAANLSDRRQILFYSSKLDKQMSTGKSRKRLVFFLSHKVTLKSCL